MAAMSNIDIHFHSAEYRQCTVDGKKALFHRWFEKENLMIHLGYRMNFEKMKEAADAIRKSGIIPCHDNVEKLKGLVALVEFEDGTMAEVEALSVRFLDSGEKFNEFFWRDKV